MTESRMLCIEPLPLTEVLNIYYPFEKQMQQSGASVFCSRRYVATYSLIPAGRRKKWNGQKLKTA